MPSRPTDPPPLGGEPETVTSYGARAARVDLALSVAAESYIGVYPLPVQGQVTIGRDPLADFSVDHPSLSRRHATIDVGRELTITDLGSKNGTHVGERPLAPGAPAALAVGDSALIGGVRLTVVAWGARGEHASLLGRTAFQSRVEYECARARRTRRPFSIVRLRVTGSPSDRDAIELTASAIGPAVAATALGPREIAALVGEGELSSLEERVRRALGPRRAVAQLGVATFPGDGQSPEALLTRAEHHADGRSAIALPGRHVIVVDPAMVRLHAMAKRVAASTVSVLLLGETGCGKEILAETIHAASPRARGPFVRLNCAAIAGNLLESELFGHEKGAYSGAVQAKPGLLEIAHGGTAFLDEIGELPLEFQAKLLRFLEDGELRRVGALRSKRVDVRIVAATNRDLERDADTGAFRADLYHRLNGLSLTIPPLRDRPGEIAALATQFLEDAAKEQGFARAPRLSRDALVRLHEHRWPGNIRELRNVVRAALILGGDAAEITADSLPLHRTEPRPAPPASFAPAPPRPPASAPSRAPFRDPQEGARIAETLERCQGNMARAAQQLGISRTTLLKRMLAFGLRPPGEESPYADPDERRKVEEALAACGGNRSRAAAMLGVSRSTLVMRMLAFGLHHGDDGDR